MFNLHNTWTRKQSAVVSPCSCSTMRVNWPPCFLERKHIKLLSPVSVNFIWCWTRGPPAVLLLYCCSFSWREMVICRGSVAPGQVSHSADAQAISLTPWEAEVMPDKGEWKGSVLWFITQYCYGIPLVQGWFLLQRWGQSKLESATSSWLH